MTIPLITVGVTCFNAEDTIERAITSALAQDWPNIEILVVDDASTDSSVERVLRLVSRDSRLRLLRHDRNGGYAASLNTICDNAAGEFIAVFDDDDTSDTSRLRSQYERLRTYETDSDTELIACYTNRTVIPHDGAQRKVHCIGRASPVPHGPMVVDFLLLNERQCGFDFGELGSCTLMARTITMRHIGPFDTSFRRCAEWDWAIRLAFRGGHFIGVDRPLVTQYLTRSADKGGRIPLRYALLLRRKYRSYLREHGNYLYSVLLAYVRFQYSKRRIWRSRAYYCAALLVSPLRLVRRLRGGRGASGLRQESRVEL